MAMNAALPYAKGGIERISYRLADNTADYARHRVALSARNRATRPLGPGSWVDFIRLCLHGTAPTGVASLPLSAVVVAEAALYPKAGWRRAEYAAINVGEYQAAVAGAAWTAELESSPPESGRPLSAAFYSEEDSGHQFSTGKVVVPLAAGATSTPVGVAHVFSSTYPDLFVVTSKNSLEQGIFLYEFLELDERGVPKFRRRLQVTHPFTNKGLLPPVGSILEAGETIHGFWHVEASIIAHTYYDRTSHGFTRRKELHIQGLPNPPIGLAFIPRPAGGGDLVMEIPDHKPYKPPADKENKEELIKQLAYKDPEYNVHDSDAHYTSRDSAGIWRGGWLHSALYSVRLKSFTDSPTTTARRVTATDHDIQYGYCGLTTLMTNVTGEPERSLVVGSAYGMLYYMRNLADNAVALRGRQPLTGQQGAVLQHPYPRSAPVMYPGPDGLNHLVVGGEGSLMFYRFFMHTSESGTVPMFYPPLHITEVQGKLYAGKNPVPSAVDWDGDGRIDIVSGNAYGNILFFRNVGTNRLPAWLPGEPLRAGGVTIQVQPGYQALEGPAESRYGYTCPTVVDWNGDGTLDIVMTDGTAKHTVFLGRASEGGPRLKPGQPLYNDGLELHGPWRVKPGIAKVNGRQTYIMIDDADDLHAFYRIDDYNLKDAGKVRLRTGKPIRTHFLAGGATGRIHINLVDWDLDNVFDLLLSVPRHASVPDADLGLPSSQGFPSSVILFLRGVKQEAGKMPVFKYPEVMHFDGVPIAIGAQDGAVTPITGIGKTVGPHLLVGEESGRLILYERSRLSCESYNRFPTMKDAKKKAVETADGLEPLSWDEAIGSLLKPDEEEEEEEEAGEEQSAAVVNMPKYHARPMALRPEFDPEMMGEVTEDEAEPSVSAPGLGQAGGFLLGAACMGAAMLASRFAKPALLSVQASIRRRQGKSAAGHDRTV
eukprot:jgi/Tetstr1/437289/TSEL_002773.t1